MSGAQTPSRRPLKHSGGRQARSSTGSQTRSPGARSNGEPLARLTSGEAELAQAFEAGAPGLDLARRRASLMDAVLTDIFETAGLPAGWSLVALGGYGRGALAPHSDIDLMILHSKQGPAEAAKVAEHVFYPLWDAGLTVGTAVRTAKEAVAIAAESLETQTSFLDARLLAGDPSLLSGLERALLRQIRAGQGRRFFSGVREELERRHNQFGLSAYLLEPHIKEGLGGLRDIDALVWVGKGLLDCPSLETLAAGGHLGATDAEALVQARDFFWTVRTHLHHQAGRQDDQLTFDHQIAVAQALGYIDEEEFRATERFMTELFEHTGQVERVSSVFWEQAAARKRPYSTHTRPLGNGLRAHNGHVELVDPDELPLRQNLVLDLFSTAVREQLPVSAESIRAVQEALPSLAPFVWDEPARRALLDVLTVGSSALPTLELLTQLGVLSYLIPEWDGVRSRVQFDAYHLYTVDMHALHTVAELGRLRDGKHAVTEPMATEIAADLSTLTTPGERDVLLLAGLLHDIGKGQGHGHAERGAEMASAIARKMGLSEQAERDVVWLVRNHLLLYDTATRRDLNDERIVVTIAQDARTPERMRQLYLLTTADALATGPKAWTPWKSALVAELVTKALHVLARGEFAGRDTGQHLAELKQKVAACAPLGRRAADIEAFLESMPYAYLLAHGAEDICRHFELMEGGESAGLRAQVRPGQRQGLYEYVLVTRDQPDLFPTVAGALALSGVTILSAETYVRANSQALMVFSAADAFEKTIDQAKWDRVGADIRDALEGRIALMWRLAERAERYSRLAAPGRSKPPRIVVDNEESDFFTLVEVYATDRIGLLYTITSALRELRLEIHQARISTAGDEAADVFYVLDRYGQKLAHPAQIEEVAKTIRYALTRPM